jgi:hypothetical protein
MRDEILNLNPSEIRLPDSIAGCRERIKTLQDEIASIRIQIATTDIRRQVEKKTSDPALFHRSKTALRIKQQELKLTQEELRKLSGKNDRDRFKDALIDVVRDDFDDEQWIALISRARLKLTGDSHG